MKLKTLIFLFCVKLTFGQIDDEKCEAQLKYFSDSLSTREAWAIECK